MMGILKSKNQIKNEFISKCLKKKLKWLFIQTFHISSGRGKIWKIKFKCQKGHINYQSLSNFRKNPTCKKCIGLDLSRDDHIKKLGKVHNYFYKYDRFKYTGSKDLIIIYCPGHKNYFKQTYESHFDGRGCRICAGNFIKSGSQIIKLVDLGSDGFISAVNIDKKKKYKSDEKIRIKCNIHRWHKVQNKNLNKLTRGINCSICSSSNYALTAYHTLHQLGIPYETEHQIKYENIQLYIDIVLKKNKELIFIEIDGEQHSSTDHWIKSKNQKIKALKLIKIRDGQKDKYAKQNGIKLIRINYKDNIREKIISLVKKYRIKKKFRVNNNFPPSLIETNEKKAFKIHKMYNNGDSYRKIRSKFNVIDSFISKIITGDKFKELFFFLYPNGVNPNIRNKSTKHIRLIKEEVKFISNKIQDGELFANIRKEFSRKYRPISRGQFYRYAKKKKYKTPFFLNLTKKQKIKIKNLKDKGFNFNEITLILNKDGLKITRPTVQKKLKELSSINFN